MIHLIDNDNRIEYAAQLEQMFRIRHELYVELRGWAALRRDDGREIDQFDTEDAVYLLGVDDAGSVTAGIRCLPTTAPHLISEVFPHAVTAHPVIRDEKTFEITRYFVTKQSLSKAERHRASGEVLCAIHEFGLRSGAERCVVLCDTFFLPTMLECGWSVRPMGLPTPYSEGTCGAFVFQVNEAALAGTRNARAVSGGVLVRRARPRGNASLRRAS